MKYSYLVIVVFLTTLWQILFKWRSASLKLDWGNSSSLFSKLMGVFQILLDPYIFFGYVCSFAASILWIFALKKLPLSFAYPFLALPLVFVLILSHFIFNESICFYRILGATLIVVGTVLIGLKAGV